jgi:hypothetical protein
MGPDGDVKMVTHPPAGSDPMSPPYVMWCYETEEPESAAKSDGNQRNQTHYFGVHWLRVHLKVSGYSQCHVVGEDRVT